MQCSLRYSVRDGASMREVPRIGMASLPLPLRPPRGPRARQIPAAEQARHEHGLPGGAGGSAGRAEARRRLPPLGLRALEHAPQLAPHLEVLLERRQHHAVALLERREAAAPLEERGALVLVEPPALPPRVADEHEDVLVDVSVDGGATFSETKAFLRAARARAGREVLSR